MLVWHLLLGLVQNSLSLAHFTPSYTEVQGQTVFYKTCHLEVVKTLPVRKGCPDHSVPNPEHPTKEISFIPKG